MFSKITKVSALAFSLFVSFSSNATQLISNGGFETGNLSGWSTSGLGSGICPSHNNDWNVATASNTGCEPVANPSGSTYAAYVMNDGVGPVSYVLSQNFFVASGTTGGTLSFDWTSSNESDNTRTLSVILGETVVFNSTTFGIFGWKNVSIDISAALAAYAGNNISLRFVNYIPDTWTGAAGLGLDNVSLNTSGTDVPEPASIALLGLGLAGLAATRRRKM